VTRLTTEEAIAYNTRRAAECADKAAALLEAGFASEARRKEALDYASRAYQNGRDAARDTLLPGLWNAEGTERDEAVLALLDAMPFDLHLWRAKHAQALASACPAWVAQVAALVELRAAIKAAPVEPRPVAQEHPLLVEARKTMGVDLAALRDRRVAQYTDALDLGRTLRDRKGEPLQGLPVYVHRVWCCNYAGTVWVRLDWELNGRRVPFSTVAAAYDTLVREGTIVVEKA
jgi:hypothetical protein